MPRVTSARNLRASRNQFDPPSEARTGAAGTTVVLASQVSLSLLSAAGATANTFTVPNGTSPGQRRSVALVAKGGAGEAAVTPATMVGGTSVTLGTVGETVEFQWSGSAWFILSTNGGVIA